MAARKFDNLGRITIPKDFRDELGFKEQDVADIELEGNKIVIMNFNKIKSREEIENQIKKIYKKNKSYNEGYNDALKWVLNDK